MVISGYLDISGYSRMTISQSEKQEQNEKTLDATPAKTKILNQIDYVAYCIDIYSFFITNRWGGKGHPAWQG